jgi:DNA-directed RNA polymerase specialized sigma subunit
VSHIEKKEFEIYRITPPPPKWDLQEYIRQYVQTGDDKYFYWFLHYYEPLLNEKAKFFRKKYKIYHFSDIKQSLVTGLCRALLNYDISISPFLPYAQRYMEREAHSYIRTMRTGYSVQSEFEYARLKKAMAIYSELGGKYSEETITKVSEQLGESYEKTKSIIEGGILTESYTDIQNKKDDDDESESSIIVPDSSLNPENIYFKQELYGKLYEAYDSLEYTEKIMLAQHLGFCPECFSTRYADKNDLGENYKPKEKPIKPLPYTDIATDHGFSDADTAKRVCERALEKIHNKLLS